MRQGDKFSDERVRQIKLALLRGSHPRAIARLEGVMTATIVRIRDGETYKHVKVAGEEGLRPEVVAVDYDPKGPRVDGRAIPMAVVPISDEEIAAAEQRLLGVQAAVNAAKEGHLIVRKSEPTTSSAAAEALAQHFGAGARGATRQGE